MESELRGPVETLAEQVAGILTKATHLYGTNELEPLLRPLLYDLQAAGTDRGAATRTLLALLEPKPPFLPLGQAGIVEILQFCMYSLRWPEIRSALSELTGPGNDPRIQRNAERVLETFDDSWADAFLFSLYRSDDDMPYGPFSPAAPTEYHPLVTYSGGLIRFRKPAASYTPRHSATAEHRLVRGADFETSADLQSATADVKLALYTDLSGDTTKPGDIASRHVDVPVWMIVYDASHPADARPDGAALTGPATAPSTPHVITVVSDEHGIGITQMVGVQDPLPMPPPRTRTADLPPTAN